MPKWTNKGHEFDELGNYFRKNKNILILGYDEKKNNKIKEKLNFLAAKVNITTKKVNTFLYYLIKYFGIAFLPKNTIIIVEQDSPKILRRLLSHKSVQQNKNLFFQNDFFEKYLSIFALYVADITYSESQCIILTTHCTLNCKHCLNLNPYIKDKSHNDFEEIKKSIDTYFKAFDYCGLFHLSGGETFMWPHCSELLKYIYNNYKDRYVELGASSNLVVALSDELCQTLHDCQVVLFVDDYTNQIDEKKIEIFNQSLEKLKKHNVNYAINKGSELRWFSIFPPVADYTKLTENDLACRYDKCGYRNSEIRNGFMNNCNYSGFAQRAGVIEQDYSEWYDLNTYTKDKKFELIEYRLGYSEKGYPEFCKYCNGYININPNNFVPVGEQFKGTLSWNRENPLEIIYDKETVE